MDKQLFEGISQKLQLSQPGSYRPNFPISPELLDDPRFLRSGADDGMLLCWSRMLNKILPPFNVDIQIPEDADRFEAMHTVSSGPVGRLTKDGDEKGIEVFVFMNKPVDMGSAIYRRIILDDGRELDDRLARVVPLLVTCVWGSTYVAESPLMFDAENPTDWHTTVDQVISDIS